ncbi:hypothetical protein [Winogradskyella alexanderae]|uniref:Uncharacterized protein n=1 Tax=Winogradskyella alexanderae TaxID=2877123 RepID=A0ABS7XP21_9FLAO|nr:hypothetical protein [Winogradskyella alexanderae]MCA0131758.1 hypothetical protein [Winogradskyella alexanderae]
MDYEIINCYELDVRQDIPTEMEVLKITNRKLESKNRVFVYLIASIGFGVIVWSIVQSLKKEKIEKDDS